MTRKRYYYLIIFCVLTGCNTQWHTFQANNARTGYVDRPEIEAPQLLWKTHIGIQGYLNNSIVTSKNIYVGSSGTQHNTPDSSDGIYCLNKENGKIIWHFQTQSDACGVAYSKNYIYATGDDGYLRCLNATNGVEKWKIKREGQLYSQPLILNNSVIVGDASGTLLIVNKNNGNIIVEKKVADSNIRGGLSSDGKYIYAAFVEGKIMCLDAAGNSIWEVQGEFSGQYGKDFQGIYGAPTIVENQLIVPFVRSTYYDHPAVNAYDKTNGTLIWKAINNTSNSSFGNLRSSVAVWKEYLFFGSPYSNMLTAIGLKDGALKWRMRMGESTHFHWPSPVIAENTLYLGRHDGGLNVIDLEKQEVLWQLFIGDHKKTENRPKDYGQSDRIWASAKWDTIPSVYATPSIDTKGTLFVGNGQGWLFAIGNTID